MFVVSFHCVNEKKSMEKKNLQKNGLKVIGSCKINRFLYRDRISLLELSESDHQNKRHSFETDSDRTEMKIDSYKTAMLHLRETLIKQIRFAENFKADGKFKYLWLYFRSMEGRIKNSMFKMVKQV